MDSVPHSASSAARQTVIEASRFRRWLCLLCVLVGFALIPAACVRPLKAQTAAEVTDADAFSDSSTTEDLPVGYVVDIPLPIVGDRDAIVAGQLEAIRSGTEGTRPTVILNFGAETGDGTGSSGRGSQFERCLALARDLIDWVPHARLVAFVPKNVEGHAVLPILACEELIIASDATLGAAAIDEPADDWIMTSYQNVSAKRGLLPTAIVRTMLDPEAVAIRVQIQDSATPETVGKEKATQLRSTGAIESEDSLWDGGGLASYTGEQLSRYQWALGNASSLLDAAKVAKINTSLRSVSQLPRDWKPVQVTLAGELSNVRVNQIIRGLTEQVEDGCNLILIRLRGAKADMIQATRLAEFLESEITKDVYRLVSIEAATQGPVGVVLAAADEVVMVGNATIGPDVEAVGNGSPESIHRTINELATGGVRPVPLLAAICSPEILVKEFVHQDTGERAIFTDWQIEQQAGADRWLEKRTVAGGKDIDLDLAVRYRLIDSVDGTRQSAFGRLGLEQEPPELKLSWIDAGVQLLASQTWLPRLLMMIGFFALMAELSAPGIGVGGFLSAFCFVGFFWLEGLNGNVEALEVVLFIFGLVALGLELFVIPGFGIFGIGGLLMLLVSIVLASQTFVLPTNSAQLSQVAVNLFWVACLALGGMVGLLLMHRRLENSPLLRWVTLEPPTPEMLEDRDGIEATRRLENLLGQNGITTTRLNPSGKAQFGNSVVSVVGTGNLIGEGIPVTVVEVRGPLILVEEVEA
ncbi:MAG TPA: hypothetical protein DDW52_09880 [Planctomycetaceae bacterium]|nr:hypothetical protein [Planctomycetaceae bacterium]